MTEKTFEISQKSDCFIYKVWTKQKNISEIAFSNSIITVEQCCATPNLI